MKPRTEIPKKVRLRVLTEAGYRCACPSCPNELTVEVHHIVEISKGGENVPQNLLPLCPYCHDKYHRGIIDKSSIEKWKQRIVSLYSGTTEPPKAHPPDSAPNGYAYAFAQYSRRTYPIYLFYNYKGRTKFYSAGYATFVQSRKLVTCNSVLEKIKLLQSNIPEAAATLLLGETALNFRVKEIHTWGGIVLLESDPIKNRYAPASSVATEFNLDLPLPDETPLSKVAATPYVGQEVGFLFGSRDTEQTCSIHQYAFTESAVSHFLRTQPVSLDQYALSPIHERIEYLGGPVFMRDGTLVGVVTGSLPIGEDTVDVPLCRPVISGFWGVDSLRRKKKGVQPSHSTEF